MEASQKLEVGMLVRKKEGYSYHGKVVSIFKKTDGKIRCVVECDVKGCEGMLHIFNCNQIIITDEN